MKLEYNIYYEVSASIFLAFMALYMKLQYSMSLKRNRAFFKLALIVLFACVMDVVSAIGISNADVVPYWLNVLLSTLYFVADGVLSMQFLVYVLEYDVKKNEKHYRAIDIGEKVLIWTYILIMVANCANGWIFTFDSKGNYYHGPLYLIVYIVPYAFFCVASVYMIAHARTMNIPKRISIILYSIVSISGAIIQILFLPDVLLSVFTVAVGIVIIQFSLETPEFQKLTTTMDELRVVSEIAKDTSNSKTRFLKNMSKEIDSPIRRIMEMDDIILESVADNPNLLMAAKEIKEASNTLWTIASDIKEYTLIESGKMEIKEAEYDLQNLVEKSCRKVKEEADSKSLKIKIETESKLPRNYIGDGKRIAQCLDNLLSNAVKYTDEGEVTVRIKTKAGAKGQLLLLISVEDTGVGLSENDKSKLFKFFEKDDEKSDVSNMGLGIGLALTKRFVELMNGEVGAYSTLGKGSLFYLEIPQKLVAGEIITGIEIE